MPKVLSILNSNNSTNYFGAKNDPFLIYITFIMNDHGLIFSTCSNGVIKFILVNAIHVKICFIAIIRNNMNKA